ncbi:hypothetical protein EVAR_18690_1 [Eumeta japonica]|uniref:Uncharacterized protein n=1 Tax=Eumeta variegata TaxID=151549 RepID=A0A4C1U6V4_EUMVA|nr:hypothetical protein EVAR_18690_1 [Eumeta japonica]
MVELKEVWILDFPSQLLKYSILSGDSWVHRAIQTFKKGNDWLLKPSVADVVIALARQSLTASNPRRASVEGVRFKPPAIETKRSCEGMALQNNEIRIEPYEHGLWKGEKVVLGRARRAAGRRRQLLNPFRFRSRARAPTSGLDS